MAPRTLCITRSSIAGAGCRPMGMTVSSVSDFGGPVDLPDVADVGAVGAAVLVYTMQSL